ncbi:MAG: hypothetical protein LBL66_05615 [Clostridiales bacterium]|jgi:hypothetical protein|nr:hypothetical protein [Clostridiales bacterium]
MVKQTNKRHVGRLFAVAACLALAFGYLSGLPLNGKLFKTARADFDDGLAETIAYLDYTANSWTNYGVPDDEGNANAKYHKPATVRGAGTYVAGFDFSEIAAGQRPQTTQYIALQIKNGPDLYPGWAIRLMAVRVNGSDIDIAGKGYTNDEGGNTRMNIYNDWVDKVADGARSWDDDLESATWKVIDRTAFGAATRIESLEVEFMYMPVGNPIDVAYLGGAAMGGQPDSWTAVPNGAQSVKADVAGNGYYTVGVVGTSNFANPNFALIVVGAADDYPGCVIRIVDVRVAVWITEEGTLGEYTSIAFSRGNTRDEGIIDGKNSARSNMYNQYAPDVGVNDRTWDENYSEMTGWVLPSGAIQGYRAILVDFQFIPIEAGEVVDASIEYADAGWDAVYFNDIPESNAVPTVAHMKNVGNYKIGIDFTATPNQEARGIDQMNIRVADGEKFYAGWYLRIQNITVNGTELLLPEEEQPGGLLPGITYPDGDDMVMNIFTKTQYGKIPGQRSDQSVEIFKASHMRIQDASVFDRVETIEISFRFVMMSLPEVLPIDALDHLKNARHSFYFGVQAEEQYTFRNAWSEKNYGLYGEEGIFDMLYRTDGATHECGGTFTDVENVALADKAAGGADYSVKMEIGSEDAGFTGENNLSLLFVSTTIYYDLYYQGNVTFYDMTVVIDGRPFAVGENAYRILSTADERSAADLEKDPIANPAAYPFAQIQFVNTWSNFVPVDYPLPAESVEILFSVSYELEPEAQPVIAWGADMGTEGRIGDAFRFTFDVTSENDNLAEPHAFDVDVAVMFGAAAVDVAKTGDAYSFTPAAAGDYWIKVTATDERGNAATAEKMIFVAQLADKTALQSKYDAVKDTQKGNFTDESWTEFQSKLTAAKTVLDDADASQSGADDALAALNAAFDGLAPVKTGCGNAASAAAIGLFLVLGAALIAGRKR